MNPRYVTLCEGTRSDFLKLTLNPNKCKTRIIRWDWKINC